MRNSFGTLSSKSKSIESRTGLYTEKYIRRPDISPIPRTVHVFDFTHDNETGNAKCMYHFPGYTDYVYEIDLEEFMNLFNKRDF
jgi:hypothetical protein